MKLKLIRLEPTAKYYSLQCTMGRLSIIDITLPAWQCIIWQCFTLEELWRNNQRDNPNTPEEEASCIPAGQYFLRRRVSPKFGVTPYLIGSQPARDYVLIHPGNTVLDIIGCIAVGDSFGKVQSRYNKSVLLDGVLNSRNTFKKLMEKLEASEEWIAGKDIPFEIIGFGSPAPGFEQNDMPSHPKFGNTNEPNS